MKAGLSELKESSKLAYSLSQTRNELNNIRKTLYGVRAQHKEDVARLTAMLEFAKSCHNHSSENEIARSSEQYPSEKLAKQTFLQTWQFSPVGTISSIHRQKNGTPRQGVVSSFGRGKLTIMKNVYNNPAHSLEGLQEYSHVWLIYVFHQNTSDGSHAKVSPPRLDGHKLGIFSTRSPHRPNPIGLTLAKLDAIKGDSLLLSGLDIIDGTPILDIKPYIPNYDSPNGIKNCQHSSGDMYEAQIRNVNQASSLCSDDLDPQCLFSQHCQQPVHTGDNSDKIKQFEDLGRGKALNDLGALQQELDLKLTEENMFDVNPEIDIQTTPSNTATALSNENFKFSSLALAGLEVSNNPEAIKIPQWITSPPSSGLQVIFNPIADQQIKLFSLEAKDPSFRLEYLKSDEELKCAIASILAEDPRSTYRRQKCADRLYYFMVDSAHITTCFFGEVVEVLRVCPPDEDNPRYKLL